MVLIVFLGEFVMSSARFLATFVCVLSLTVSLLADETTAAKMAEADKQKEPAAVQTTEKKTERRIETKNGMLIFRDVPYVKDGHERQKLDLYLPKNDKPLPVVVWIHGGGWVRGDKQGGPAISLADKGFAVASLNYRLSGDAIFPAPIEDCKAAVRWLRANAKKYNLDSDRFGVWGASAGGHLAALLAVSSDMKEFDVGDNLDQSSAVRCVVDWYGPTNFTTLGAKDDKPDSFVSKMLGASALVDKKQALRAGATSYVDKNDPPFLIMHGEEDKSVAFGQSVEMEAALKKAGVECEFVRIAGAKHGGPEFETPEMRKKIEDFLTKHLKTEPAR